VKVKTLGYLKKSYKSGSERLVSDSWWTKKMMKAASCRSTG